MYSGTKLIDALARQHQNRSTVGLFKSGTFKLDWRAKVGSFPHPDTETIVSAGEPCGSWRTVRVVRQGRDCPSRPEDKRNVGENWNSLPDLPLNGYVPAASIRGIVRAWASKHPAFRARMQELLGYQTDATIFPGRIEFLDAFPTEPTKITLDIVNPQQDFQVFHEGQSTPLSLYTLGDGREEIEITVAIRGTHQATPEEVRMVWEWVQQALSTYGIGSRTASGYGVLKAPVGYKNLEKLPTLAADFSSKKLDFTLYSQGNSGPDMKTIELRPAHWRGWLRSWLMRFFLGVMSRENAEFTVGELMGTLDRSTDGKSRQGSIRLQLLQSPSCWGAASQEGGYLRFYKWRGSLKLSAPKDILNEIILPIVRIAARVGGVGKGWRRPLHRFVMGNNNPAARGSQLELTHKVRIPDPDRLKNVPFAIGLNPNDWLAVYDKWQAAVKRHWPERYLTNIPTLNAEVFSPKTCAVYLVLGPDENPIDPEEIEWNDMRTTETRGEGMDLIYQPKYKRKSDVGGDAGNGGAYCSWVSIARRVTKDGCQEVVCLFMGDNKPLRSQFLTDLANIDDSINLFGIQPPARDRPNS